MFNNFIRVIKLSKPLSFFLITAATFGLFFIVATPPFQGADEEAHFFRVYQISGLNIVADDNGGKIGGSLPVSVGEVNSILNTPNIAFYPQLKYDIKKIHRAMTVDNTNKKRFYEFPASAIYSPAAYIISAPLMGIANLVGLPPVSSIYIARLGNLITWLIFIGFAIYFLPYRKWAMAAVGLLPMALFQASTLNGDAVAIGSVALFLSYILYIRERRLTFKSRDLIILLIIATVMVLSKQVMFIFLPLVLLISQSRFDSKKIAILAKLSIALIPLVLFAFWTIINSSLDTSGAYDNKQNAPLQLSFIIHNPHSYINAVWNTYFFTWGDSVTRSFIGTFGWSDAPLSYLIATIGYVGLFIILFGTDSSKLFKFSKVDKAIIWSTIILYWAAVTTSLYLYYSPLHFKIVYGLQGRYFIPLAILGVVLFASKKIQIEKDLYQKIAVYLPIFMLIASLITIFVRYYVNNV